MFDYRAGKPPKSLDQLLRDKQDQLRGRPEDWIDRFKDRWSLIDWDGVFISMWFFGCALGLMAVGAAMVIIALRAPVY